METEEKIAKIQGAVGKLQEAIDELSYKLENMDPEDAATMLLEHYLSNKPGAGDVDALKRRITDILVSEFGVSRGILP